MSLRHQPRNRSAKDPDGADGLSVSGAAINGSEDGVTGSVVPALSSVFTPALYDSNPILASIQDDGLFAEAVCGEIARKERFVVASENKITWQRIGRGQGQMRRVGL